MNPRKMRRIPLAAIVVAALFASGCEKKESLEETKARGKRVFVEHNCAMCHSEGPGNPGTANLSIIQQRDEPVLEKRKDLDRDYVKRVVRYGLVGGMAPFRPTEISDKDLDALAAYLASN